MSIKKRKDEHIDISVKENVSNNHNYWDDIVLLTHRSVPGVNADDINLEVELFGKRIGAPIMIEALTGGSERGGRVNEALAKVAEEMRLPMEVGSMRPAIGGKGSVRRSYSVLKDYDVPLRIANLGLPQFLDNGGRVFGSDEIRTAMDLIDADAIAIHLNFLQEVVQPEGDNNASDGIETILDLAKEFRIIVKETGAGLGREVIKDLAKGNVAGFDVGGVSGTTFAGVEYYRAKDRGMGDKARLGLTFWDWGIPSPLSLMICSDLRLDMGGGFAIIASGGLRSGLDAFRALLFGADVAAYARMFLEPALEGYNAAINTAKAIIDELRTAMFLSGMGDLAALRALAKEGWRSLVLSRKVAFRGELYSILTSPQIASYNNGE